MGQMATDVQNNTSMMRNDSNMPLPRIKCNNDQITSVATNDNIQMATDVQNNTAMMRNDSNISLPRINRLFNDNTNSASSFTRMNNDNIFGNALTNTMRNNQFVSCGQSSNNNQAVGAQFIGCGQSSNNNQAVGFGQRNNNWSMNATQSNNNQVTSDAPMGMSFNFNFKKKSMMRTEMIIVPPIHLTQEEEEMLSFNELSRDAPVLPHNEELRRYGVFLGYRESRSLDIELEDNETPVIAQREENQITPQKNLKRCNRRDQDSDEENLPDDDDDDISALCKDLSKRVRMEKTAAEVALRKELEQWTNFMCFNKSHPAIFPEQRTAFWTTRLSYNRNFEKQFELAMKFPDDYPNKAPIVTQTLPLIVRLPGIRYTGNNMLEIETTVLRNWQPSNTIEDILREIMETLHH